MGNPAYRGFQSTHSLRSATIVSMAPVWLTVVSIHALLAECDSFNISGGVDDGGFNPRTPCGVRLATGRESVMVSAFQSTHSLRSATRVYGGNVRSLSVSIHALLAECDFKEKFIVHDARFQSTHSLRSATRGLVPVRMGLIVSIHALLAECDCMQPDGPPRSLSFNPRTPCGVRPMRIRASFSVMPVSIHALLAECDATDFIHYYSTEQIILCANLPKKTVIARLHFLSIYLSIFYSQCITPIADLPGNSCELEVGAQAMFHSL